MRNIARTKEHTLEAQRRVCPERWCARGAWLVQRDARLQDVWQVTHETDGGAWTVAATDPVCPRCGTTLTTIIELEAGPETRDSIRSSAVLDGIRAL
jgi:ribosomal protein S27AE